MITQILASSILALVSATSAYATPQTLAVTVTEKGFEPSTLKVQAGDDVTLKVTRKTDETCATTLQIPDLKIKQALPLNQTVVIKLGTLSKGSLKFGCTMDMMESAVLVIE